MNWTLIIAALAAGLMTCVEAWGRWQAQAAGAALASAQAASAANAATASAYVVIAQAEAAAPRTQPALIDRLKAGSF